MRHEVEGRRCRKGVERLVPGLGGEGLDDLHVPGETDGEEGTLGAERGQRSVVMAAALAETVAREVGCNEGDEEHVGARRWSVGAGFRDAAVAGGKVCVARPVEGERAVAGNAGEGGFPAGVEGRRLECGGVDLVADGGEAAQRAGGAEVGEGLDGERGFEAAPDGARECCDEGGAGGAGLFPQGPEPGVR